MRGLFIAAVTLGWNLSLAAGPPGQFAIDEVLGAPFAHDLAAGGSTVAWVHTTRGVRNVWAAIGPQFEGRQLTNYTADDGQDIGDLEVTPDGRSVFFVRGGDANRRGEIPNPTSSVDAQEQAIWRVVVDGAAPVKVGAGTGPQVSPGGNSIVYLVSGQVWTAPVDGSVPPKQLFKARGSVEDLCWSPDGERLAFASNRGDHAFIGVYEIATRKLSWMAPGFDRDRAPAWSPDSRQLAFVRIPAGFTPPLFGPIRSGPPWSLWVADVTSGKARRVWQAATGDGSVLRRLSAPPVMWAADNRLIFHWERDGWSHLYSVSTSGGEQVLLTPGEGEVEYVALSQDRTSVIYNTNIGDIDRRDLYRVDVRGGAPVALQKTRGIEWSPRPLADGKGIAFLRSDARIPSHAVLLLDGRVKVLAPGALPATFPARRLVEPSAVIFDAADGMKIPAQLFLPPDIRPGDKHPALIFFHGGSRRQMLLGFHYMFYYHATYAMNQWLASQGYIVLSVNYRSGTGYGMKFREAENYGPAGAAEYYDVVGAGLYLKNRPDVDGRRIGLWGGSYGGYLTAMGLAKSSDLFAAGVDVHGVHDWNSGIRNFLPDYNTLEKPDAARLAFESSPLRWVDGWRSPVLIIHGDDDRNVNFNESVRLVQALRDRGLEPEQLVLPDEVHDFLTFSTWMQVGAATADFFHRKLGQERRPQ